MRRRETRRERARTKRIVAYLYTILAGRTTLETVPGFESLVSGQRNEPAADMISVRGT
jgi:hypothetical protein